MPPSSGPHPAAAGAVLDPDRLRALAATGLLDAAPEDSFDRVTRLIRRALDVPVALVSLVDADRQVFKSQQGLAEPWCTLGETPLSHSFCQHVVGTGETFAVEDARAHPVVCDNAAVEDLGVASYLGVPVRDPSGRVLGSLCAIGDEPRTWTGEDHEAMAALAASVEGEVALRAELAEREAAEALARAEADALDAVVGANARLAGELDPDRFVQAVVDAGVETTGATMGAFFYRPVRGAGDALLFAARGVSPAVRDAFAVLRRTPEVAAAFAAPVRSGDVHGDPALGWVAGLVGDEVGSFVAVPVHDASGDAIGTLAFGHPAPDALDAHAERAAVAIADQAAVGLQNARLHRALDESERDHRALLADLSDVVFRTDAEGRYTYLNAAWEDHTGHTVADTLGRPFLEFTAGDRAALAERFAASMARATTDDPDEGSLRVEVACADGEARHFEVHGRATFDAAGALTGSAGTLTNVTDTVRYHAEREARAAAEAARCEAERARAEAERMARLQSAFLANMSHELRTPLTAILGNAEILMAEAPPDLAGPAESIGRGGRRLMGTLNAVLDLAQIEAGKMEPAPRPTDVAALVTAALRDVAPLAQAKGLGLAVDAEPWLPPLAVDPGLLDRAVANLVGNAVKFTEAGQVTARVRWDGAHLTVEVEDTGIGIAPDAQDRLFDPFEQASDGHDRTHEGNGLGLALVRRVVALLGGAVSVESTPGEGSRFTIAVPALAAEAPRPRPT